MIPNIPLSSVVTRVAPPTGPRRKLLHHLSDNDYELQIDNTSLTTFQECDRSALWSLVHGRKASPSYALIYGKIVHHCLEQLYAAKRSGATPDETKILASAEAMFQDTPPPVGEWRTFDKLSDMFRRYVKRYEGEDQTMRIESVERAFAQPLMSVRLDTVLPFDGELLTDRTDGKTEVLGTYVENLFVTWTGVIDIMAEQNEKHWIVDHKTNSVEGPSFWTSFELSQQFHGYVWAAQKIAGHLFDGAIVNAIYGTAPAKTAATQKSHRDKEFTRQYYYYKQEHVEEWETNTKRTIENFIHELTDVNGFPMKPHHCVHKFGTCKFHDVCRLVPQQRLTMLNSDQFVPNVWNPLD